MRFARSSARAAAIGRERIDCPDCALDPRERRLHDRAGRHRAGAHRRRDVGCRRVGVEADHSSACSIGASMPVASFHGSRGFIRAGRRLRRDFERKHLACERGEPRQIGGDRIAACGRYGQIECRRRCIQVRVGIERAGVRLVVTRARRLRRL